MNGRVGYREQYPEPPPVFGYPVDGGLMSHDRYLKYLVIKYFFILVEITN